MSVSYRVRCECGATIARGTYEELTAAMTSRDWEFDGNTATCLECRIAA